MKFVILTERATGVPVYVNPDLVVCIEGPANGEDQAATVFMAGHKTVYVAEPAALVRQLLEGDPSWAEDKSPLDEFYGRIGAAPAGYPTRPRKSTDESPEQFLRRLRISGYEIRDEPKKTAKEQVGEDAPEWLKSLASWVDRVASGDGGNSSETDRSKPHTFVSDRDPYKCYICGLDKMTRGGAPGIGPH
jgi:hypothetical protein